MKLANSLFVLVLSTATTFTFLIFLAYQQTWKYHLEVDVWGFYYPRLVYFLQNLSFANYSPNEYFPGAMFFFLIPGFVLLFGQNSWHLYLLGLFIVNILLILIHLYIYRRYTFVSPFIFLIILLFTGPIILYRHDLFVSLFLIVALLLFRIQRFYFSAFTLGLASSIKIYPLLIFPYFLSVIFRRKSYQKILPMIAIFALGLGSIFAAYLILGLSINDILEPARVNSMKPVHVESIWGSLLTLINRISKGSWPVGHGAHGVFGIAPQDIFLPLNFYNYFWLVPLLIFYSFIYKKIQASNLPIVETTFLIILIFLIFSKIITPQYIFWFATLLPLFDWRNQPKTTLIFLVSTLAVVLITQVIYPLHYNELLGEFYKSGTKTEYFYLLLLRNLLLIILFILVFRSVFSIVNLKNHERHPQT